MSDHVHRWTVLDVERGVFEPELLIGSAREGDTSPYSIRKRTLRGGLQDGVETIEVDNGTTSMVILPTRGMGIWQVECGDVRLGWNSPVRGPVHPQWVPLTEPGGLGWLDGFDEWFVRCGLESNGAPEFDDGGRLRYPLHGRIANRPAHRVEIAVDDESGEITVTGVVEETRFHFQKLRLTSTIRTRIGTRELQVHDRVENFSGNPTDAQLLYHINFGPPLLTPGAELVLPSKRITPRDDHAATDVDNWQVYGAATAGSAERVYFFDLLGDDDGQTTVLLKSADGAQGVRLKYDVRQLPCFSQWKNTPAEPDGYVTGLEPATNFPNPRSFEQQHGRVVPLAAGASRDFVLNFSILPTATDVQGVADEIGRLQANQTPRIDAQPQPDWCHR